MEVCRRLGVEFRAERRMFSMAVGSALRAQPRDFDRRDAEAPRRRHLLPVPPLPDLERNDPVEIPDPAEGFVRALAVQAYEVLVGRRNPSSLGPLVSVALSRRLLAMRAIWNDRQIVYRDHRNRPARAAGVRVAHVAPGAAEASVVLHVGGRAHAVAIRLEWVHRHWRACELIVL